jgi:hypothetical protein
MVLDILGLADDHFRLPTGSTDLPSEGLPISRAMLDNSTYLRLKDSCIDLIANTTDPKLKEARDLIERLHSRDLYKFAGEKEIGKNDSKTWSQSEKDIKHYMTRYGPTFDIDGQGTQIRLHEDDFIVERCVIHHGRKEENPISRMRFVEKSRLAKLTEPIDELPEAVQPDESKYDALLPRSFQKNSIRVYARDPAKVGFVNQAFEAFLSEMEVHIQCPMIDNMICEIDGDHDDQSERQPLPISQDFTQESEDNNSDEDEDDRYQSPPPKRSSTASHVTPLGRAYT